MRQPSVLRRAALAGALALSLTGMAAAVGPAEAMPAAPALATPSAALTAVQYHYYHRYRRYHGYRGRAGLYNCGPYALHTHLQRKACR